MTLVSVRRLRRGPRFKTGAERAAGSVLVILGIAFAAQHVLAR